MTICMTMKRGDDHKITRMNFRPRPVIGQSEFKPANLKWIKLSIAFWQS